MIGFVYVISSVVRLFLWILQLLMIFRALLSWLPIDEESSLPSFLYAMTEPLVYPIRLLLCRFEVLEELPFDVSFVVTYILLSILRIIL